MKRRARLLLLVAALLAGCAGDPAPEPAPPPVAAAPSGPLVLVELTGLTWGAVSGLGWGQSSAPVLALFEVSGGVERALLSWDGTHLLLVGKPDTTRDALLEACEVALESAGRAPKERPAEEARAAWEQRGDPTRWLAPDDLWRLSWREAETFADRLLAVLAEQTGESLDGLRGLFVESFFEGIRPDDGTGPAPSAWKRRAPVSERREVILARAAELYEAGIVEKLTAFLEDSAAVRKALRPQGS